MIEIPAQIAAAIPVLARGDWFELLIPVIMVIIFSISGIAKARSESQKKKNSQRPAPRQSPGQYKYKALNDDLTPARRPTQPYAAQQQQRAPRQPRQDTMKFPELIPDEPVRRPPQVQPQTQQRPAQPQGLTLQQQKAQQLRQLQLQQQRQRQAKRQQQQAPKPQRQVVKQPPREKEPPPVPEKTVEAGPSIFSQLSGRSELQRAILFSEILGKPKALQDL